MYMVLSSTIFRQNRSDFVPREAGALARVFTPMETPPPRQGAFWRREGVPRGCAIAYFISDARHFPFRQVRPPQRA
jgi:hypothetical protein